MSNILIIRMMILAVLLEFPQSELYGSTPVINTKHKSTDNRNVQLSLYSVTYWYLNQWVSGHE